MASSTFSTEQPIINLNMIDFSSPSYRDAYSRINALVIVGESLADRNYRALARLIPTERDHLLALAAMEGRHVRDFVSCGKNLKIKPSLKIGQQLFAPLEKLFLQFERKNDVVGCIVIQGVIIECFAVAAYRSYLQVADEYAKKITSHVINDEALHLNHAETWLQESFHEIQDQITNVCKASLPIALSILRILTKDLEAVGMEYVELMANFSEEFTSAMVSVGMGNKDITKILVHAAINN